MRPRASLTTATGLALILVSFIATPVAGSSGAAAAAERAEHDRIVAYWTTQRMAAAVPRDLQVAGSPVIPAAKGGIPGPPSGGGGGGGGGGSTAVTGASWTKGGSVDYLTGKVFFTLSGGNWQCSGSVVTDTGRANYSLAMTAGHCAVDETNGSFATNWMFMPDWDRQPASFSMACSGTFYGCWTASALVVHYGFRFAGGFNQQATTHDWAFAVVPAGGKNTTQLDALGQLGIQFSNPTWVDAFGYPAAGKYSGNDLVYCAGNVFSDQYNANRTWGLACDMTGGASGGPWLAGFSESTGDGGSAASLNSYKYSSLKSYMYGPKFNGQTQDTWTAAKSATTNTTVGTSP